MEPIIQCEVSQKEKHQYNILIHICAFRKMVLITICVRKQKRYSYKTVIWTLWEKARVG